MTQINHLEWDLLPQQPHGGVLVNQQVPEAKRASEVNRARTLPSIRVDMEAVITIEMIATGVLSPNKGFMKQQDYLSVLEQGRLSDGTVWPVPLSFAPIGEQNQKIITSLQQGDEVALIDANNEPVAILDVEEIFAYDKAHRAKHLFGTTDRSHPGVDSIYQRMGDTAIGGTLHLLQRAHWGPFEKMRMTPQETWQLFYGKKKFNSVAGFITGANPLHRGHEYIHRNALEEVDAIFVQPLVEMAKREYVRHEYRMLAYRNVFDTYYPKERALLAPLRVTYIFAGPREAILHALIMKNYGCTHALIGRDHAGIGDFYDKYASHGIFSQYKPEELGIDIRLFHEVFYCTRCAIHATEQTCPHSDAYRLNISGTGIRELLRHGVLPPKEVVRPESAFAAIQGIQPKGVDKHGLGMSQISRLVNSMYPFYSKHDGLGGRERLNAIEPTQLTVDDLLAATQDARQNATRIYDEVYREHSAIFDHNRKLQPAWIEEARVQMQAQQQRIIGDLLEKAEAAPEESSNPYMYQDRAEAEQEVMAAKEILQQLPKEYLTDKQSVRVWNPFPYAHYRGEESDKEK